ncbi:APC family permease [Kordiimonas pumila]|uniref:APC family permease n=1 Tax=Kordiimonas pumila TaxID=2161677 RepID=A0ABV7D320_9PROT|nr:amino acid permease [Kordiimonas pumila]
MAKLKQGMSLQDVVALGISAAVGVSIFSVIAPATALAGPGILVAFGLAAIPMIIFAVLYAFLSSADPRTGASYYWPTEYVHPYVGFLVCWLRILGSAGALNIMATVFADYLQSILSIDRITVVFSLLTLFLIINVAGVSVAGGAARLLTAIKLVVLSGFIAVGLTFVDTQNFYPVLPHGTLGVVAALPLLVGLFSGIESATEAGEEVRDSKRVIGQGLGIATGISMFVYLGVTIVSIGVLGSIDVGNSRAPLAEAAAAFGYSWSGALFVITALVSIAAAINAQFLMFMRFLFAMGRDGALPKVLGKVHSRWGTPWVSAIAVYLSALVSLALPTSLVFLFLAVNIPTILKYAFNCFSAMGMMERRPDLYERAAFKMRPSVVKALAWAGIICAGLLFFAGLEADWRAYVVLLFWALIGTVYWVIKKKL